MENKTMQQLVDEYNALTGKNIKKFENKAIAIKRLQEAKKNTINTKQLGNILTKKLNEMSMEEKAMENIKKSKTYSPKQLETELGMSPLAIRKKLRKTFPDQAKKGAWVITLEMLEILRKAI